MAWTKAAVAWHSSWCDVRNIPTIKSLQPWQHELTICTAQPAGAICKKCWDEGLIVITAGSGDVVRLVPPLTVTEADVDECVGVLSSVINSMLS